MAEPKVEPNKDRDRLIHALDVDTLDEALAQAGRLRGVVTRFKVGLELYVAEGPKAVVTLRGLGARVFVDLKLHDIPETVRRAARAVAMTGAELLTVHAAGGLAMMRAAVDGAREGAEANPSATETAVTRVLAVTVLTSLDVADLAAVGTHTPSVAELVLLRARLAKEAGCDGVVASPLEARAIREALGPGFLIVTPGVRATGTGVSDQKRIGNARQAIADGADAVVVGRPIRDAADPVAAARALLTELS